MDSSLPHLAKMPSAAGYHEGVIHFFLREGRTALRWLVLGLLATTVIAMVTIFHWAIIPATLLLVAYVSLLVANELQRRSDTHEEARHDRLGGEEEVARADQEQEPLAFMFEDEMSVPILKRESKFASWCVLAVLIAAVLAAAIFFGGWMILLAVPFIFAYMLMLGGPVWLAGLNDEREDEVLRLEQTGESAPATD